MVDLNTEEKNLLSQIETSMEAGANQDEPELSINLNLLADEIFRLLKRELEIEGNRLGRQC